jgi:hypothetical protein
MLDMPYFMTNDEWYYFDYQKRKYVLTDKAPEKAKDSYKEFYKEVEYG